MSLDSLLKILVPKDKSFFPLFQKIKKHYKGC